MCILVCQHVVADKLARRRYIHIMCSSTLSVVRYARRPVFARGFAREWVATDGVGRCQGQGTLSRSFLAGISLDWMTRSCGMRCWVRYVLCCTPAISGWDVIIATTWMPRDVSQGYPETPPPLSKIMVVYIVDHCNYTSFSGSE